MSEVLIILAFCDMLTTYLIVKRNPKKYMKLEMNIIIQTMWKLFGFEKGMIIGALISLLTVWLISIYGTIEIIWFFFGAYSIVFMIHFEYLSNMYLKNNLRM